MMGPTSDKSSSEPVPPPHPAALLPLELSKAVLAVPDIRQIPSTIAAVLQQLIPHDYAAIALRDEGRTDQLRVRKLTSGVESGTTHDGLVPIDRTPAGWVFTHHEPLQMSKMDPEDFTRSTQQGHTGIKSGCWIPLKLREQVVGTLFIGCRRDISFEPRVVNALLELSGQIAGAIEIDETFRRLLHFSDKLKEEKRYLEEELRNEKKFEKVIGRSESLRSALEQVEAIAPTDQTALISGETGNGKELIARLTHQLSRRSDRIFVKLNCSALNAGHLERKFFGFEKGSFEGAISRRLGRLELAHMGTLFLKEVGELPLSFQEKLFRALQDKQVVRIGGNRPVPVDVRLIAATSRDLAKMVKAGEFHSDLYHYLNGCHITLLPLRARPEDIPLLANHFLKMYSKQMNKWIDSIPRDTMTVLSGWKWPGNARELKNFIERSVILTEGSTLRAPLVELEATQEPNFHAAERRHILRVLRETNGVIGGPGGAAEKLGLKRTTLNSKLKKLGIEKRAYR
jgi:formate hydrogenlyase transcriptional activator